MADCVACGAWFGSSMPQDLCPTCERALKRLNGYAVPVVRCKDCKHFDMQEMECKNDAVSTDHEGGASYSLNFYLDDFCSYGERKKDNATD